MQRIDHILDKLMLKPGERLMNIGCDWGSLIIRAAQNYGASVKWPQPDSKSPTPNRCGATMREPAKNGRTGLRPVSSAQLDWSTKSDIASGRSIWPDAPTAG